MINSSILKTGDCIDDYRIISEIGHGGMGCVYEVEHVKLHKQYALKLIEPTQNATHFVENFESEARIMAQLEHPNIVRVYHLGVSNNCPYFIMDLIKDKGGNFVTLKDYYANPAHQKNIEVCQKHLMQLAEAIKYAHEFKPCVVHRDLKPANVMIDAEGNIKLTDFGLAFLQEEPDAFDSLGDMNTIETARSSSGGTLAYMSPEQKTGEKPAVTDDVFAFGMIFYEMLTGKRADGRFPMPSELGIKNPKYADILVESCMAPLEKRYKSFNEVIDCLNGDHKSGKLKVVFGFIIMLLVIAVALTFILLPKEEPEPLDGPGAKREEPVMESQEPHVQEDPQAAVEPVIDKPVSVVVREVEPVVEEIIEPAVEKKVEPVVEKVVDQADTAVEDIIEPVAEDKTPVEPVEVTVVNPLVVEEPVVTVPEVVEQTFTVVDKPAEVVEPVVAEKTPVQVAMVEPPKETEVINSVVEKYKEQVNYVAAMEVSKAIPDFTIKLDVKPIGNRFDFYEGEKISFTVKADKSCYLAVFCHQNDDTSVLLYPNQYSKSILVQAHKTIEVPGLEAKGFELTVGEPFGYDVIQVIATTNQEKLDEITGNYKIIEGLPVSISSSKELITNVTRGISLKKVEMEKEEWGEFNILIQTHPKK